MAGPARGTKGTDCRSSGSPRALRYVEKLATPDVTIADMVGDIDPIKAARGGLRLSDELTVHYGLLPRANRGIFAVNELPDLAGKIQVGLLNILQEGDIQIKGYPVRLPLDVLMVFTANPEDYTARGQIITPLRDRIGSEVRTHYPQSRELAMAITEQEAWVSRECPDQGQGRGRRGIVVPTYVREVVEEVAFQARHDQKIDKRSGVSQRLPITCLENAVSNAERRALVNREDPVVARVTDVYAALPSMPGKFELEYEGELRGADNVARELIRAAVANVFASRFDGIDAHRIVEWFDLGGTLHIGDGSPARRRAGADWPGPGLGRAGRPYRRETFRPATGGSRGRGLRAGRPLRAEEDQPFRGMDVSRVGATTPVGTNLRAVLRSEPPTTGAGAEEVLQLGARD